MFHHEGWMAERTEPGEQISSIIRLQGAGVQVTHLAKDRYQLADGASLRPDASNAP
jgi:hypothetical protein